MTYGTYETYRSYSGERSTMRRPAAVTVFGVLNIIFGALKLIAAPAWILALVFRERWLALLPQGEPQVEPFRNMMTDANFLATTYLMTGVGIVSAAVLLASGIGLLRLRPWARYAAIGWGVYDCLATAIGTIVSYHLFAGPMFESMGGPLAAELAVEMMGTSISLLHPALLIVFMFMPSVKAAFEPGWGEPPPLPESASQ